MISSNHSHLLVVDAGKRDVIPKSIQSVAGRTGREYNQRKNRRGAYWEDRYHATAVESGDHLARCFVCMDASRVHASVVSHPSKWFFSEFSKNLGLAENPMGINIKLTHDKEEVENGDHNDFQRVI